MPFWKGGARSQGHGRACNLHLAEARRSTFFVRGFKCSRERRVFLLGTGRRSSTSAWKAASDSIVHSQKAILHQNGILLTDLFLLDPRYAEPFARCLVAWLRVLMRWRVSLRVSQRC